MAVREGADRSGLRHVEVLDGIFSDAAARLGVELDAWHQRRAGALETLDDEAASPEALAIARLELTASGFGALAVDLAANPVVLRDVLEQVAKAVGMPRLVIGRAVLRARELAQLRPGRGIGATLGLLVGLTDMRAVSLWTLWPSGDLRQISHAGGFKPDVRITRRLARDLLAGKLVKSRNDVAGLLVPRYHEANAVLIARGTTESRLERRLLMAAAVPMLAGMLDRFDALRPAIGSEHDVLAATERRLTRLRFDLHDGPQQDVIMLAEDLREFRARLEGAVAGHPDQPRLLGRLDDLQARLVALDGDLRRMSASVQSPFLQRDALPDAIAQVVGAFELRTSIAPRVEITGNLAELSDSQQITLLALIQEALSNIREHSQAQHVSIAVAGDQNGVVATVTDDGLGFDPETALVKAAREGHLGLVGMHERVRMLGGRTQIDSRPGGPTVISVTLPAIGSLGRDDGP